MLLVQSVGLHGVNLPADVRLVQVLLNENMARLVPLAPLVVDGHVGPAMLNAIAEFQRRVLHIAQPDSRIEPDGPELVELRAGMTLPLSMDKLHGIMTCAGPVEIARYYQPLVTMMARSEIDMPLRVAHFLAQLGTESGDLRYAEELASGSEYEGRVSLGNTQPGDGPRFKGRGLIQLTGRANYVAYGKARGADYVSGTNSLKIATDPDLAVDVACWYWTTHKLNEYADADDIRTITERINGGTNGLADREAHLQRAKCLLVL